MKHVTPPFHMKWWKALTQCPEWNFAAVSCGLTVSQEVYQFQSPIHDCKKTIDHKSTARWSPNMITRKIVTHESFVTGSDTWLLPNEFWEAMKEGKSWKKFVKHNRDLCFTWDDYVEEESAKSFRTAWWTGAGDIVWWEERQRETELWSLSVVDAVDLYIVIIVKCGGCLFSGFNII